MYSIFTSMKVFSDPWVGHPGLNRRGMHTKRVKAAMAVARFRRAQTVRVRDADEQHLLDHGFVAIPGFLPQDEFAALKAEAHASAEAADRATPLPEKPEVWGFGDADRHEWGFDRFDGSTLNRFIAPGPIAAAFPRNTRFKRLARLVTGKAMRAKRNWLYQTVNGDETEIHDIQREFHRDTFFNAMKYWFFIDPVREEDGPFVYVPGSHQLTDARIAWEQAKADAAVEARLQEDRKGMTGSFRIEEGELADLGLPPPRTFPVPENTLIVANVFGFHRRGDAVPGTRRLSLYGNHRPQPFLPFGS
ncbi:phytanoyl-CoA dioxygenase family protein [uncultured Parasphingopyxis sp.]|uniref:phytanoyl-CoA dioxygenase family protein n=1 Tax=uncultured Parasphingopyxis sp. TaxID=1547918 RepID=UPI002638C4DA|nr:phytanoyl-CoA dioxygenase family protein [uncultured Parasphingopyxis sp.]